MESTTHYGFEKARPVWGRDLSYEYNQHLGFRTDVTLEEETTVQIVIAARSYYRLYINGNMKAHGPARAAKGHCRMDEICLQAVGTIKIAIEVMAYDKDIKYCNDHTMEPGLFTAEVYALKNDGSHKSIAATGTGEFKYKELLFREPMTDLMSHCRGIIEYYRLTESWDKWRTEDFTAWKKPEILEEKVIFQKRRAPYGDYHRIPIPILEYAKQLVPSQGEAEDILYKLARKINPSWYEKLEEKESFMEEILREKEQDFHKSWERKHNKIRVWDCEKPVAFVFRIPETELGFVHIKVETEKSAIIDIINSDHKDRDGTINGNTFAVRYELASGRYDLITFEPMLVKYLKIIIRTEGKAVFLIPELLDYTYPDEQLCTFECSDGGLNKIYQGARRTLRLNTLDIFMDCPQRERGGWLCDAQFTAPGAWQMFGDLRVEKDFIENFMCTDPKAYREGFFPEVYPGCSQIEKNPGIENWSFWLLTQLWDYYHRSGDRKFVADCYSRIETFLDAMAKHIGESGLFEDFNTLFVDWSLSNQDFCLKPISIPINCLIVRSYELMGELYQIQRWKKLGAKVRTRIEEIMEKTGCGSDGYRFENGCFKGNGCRTETGIALELWCGFHKKDKTLLRTFTERMGTAPNYRPDPNIGRSNLFIGLMIRFEVLAKSGKIDALIKELKNVYLPQLLEGPGTLYEGIQSENGCHGFNANAGALLANHVLGLGQPMQLTKTVRLSPYPGEILWAQGSAYCCDGMIFFQWEADHDSHILEMQLQLPDGWKPEICLPFAWSGWKVLLNGEKL